ncbi:MarR family transcriptional regulator [Rhizobium sp. P38BS-XIX]|uniref:MarR family winged helix-turn-helix transcriptional regulator n=1 Tax=Rhizobium sp. P38BS-XIX TaxID=2726740 RepID=UPI0014563346|nr:MarR family transcriptional regulator [Rhizobium sp. P38BS-XIX]NLR99175.1 MarR family transcriptional regulator [Rhizobium sp. P38BS-XIX]
MNSRINTDSLAFLVSDCARLIRSAFERRIVAAGLGLTAGEARTLMQVAAINGSRQLDIASRMGLEPMTVSAFLDKLQARGLIERQPDPLDRRAKRIVLSEAADAKLKQIDKEVCEVERNATQGFDQEMQTQLHDTLCVFRSNLQNSELPAEIERDLRPVD